LAAAAAAGGVVLLWALVVARISLLCACSKDREFKLLQVRPTPGRRLDLPKLTTGRRKLTRRQADDRPSTSLTSKPTMTMAQTIDDTDFIWDFGSAPIN